VPQAAGKVIEASEPGNENPATGGTPDRRIRATPIARRIAAENKIAIELVPGTGPDGRITERDILAYLESSSRTIESAAAKDLRAPAVVPSGSYRGRRRTIGERMLKSLQSMAQVTLSSEVPVEDALKMLHGLNREWRRDGVGVTLTALAVRATALALRDHPLFNARFEEDEMEALGAINVGVAVALDEGLMVPVITDVDKRPLKEVAQRLHELSEKARAGTLTVDEVSGGTFTVTSLENTVVDAFTPIINPPQVGILGVGRVRIASIFEGGQFLPVRTTTLSLTFDHRANDGAAAAALLGRISELIDRPYILIN
jgi:pyruvate dehydrogenase E2 component (dihydrolipoamide acetyltransferase)